MKLLSKHKVTYARTQDFNNSVPVPSFGLASMAQRRWLSHKNIRLTIYFLICLATLLSQNYDAWAAQHVGIAPDYQLDTELKRQRIEKNIIAHQQRIEQTQTQEFNLLQELQRLDTLLRKGQEKLSRLQQILLRQEGHLQTKEHEINLLQTEKITIEKHIKKRLTAFYQTGDIAFINTLFSATTLPDLLHIEEYFQALFHYDQKIIEQYRTKLSLLNGAQATIIIEKENILATINQAREQENEIINSRLQREELLLKVKTKEELYRQALVEMENASVTLAEKIRLHKVPAIINTKKKIARLQSSKKKKPLPETGFAAQQGHLPPPIKDADLFRLFGLYTDNFGTERHSSGIDIMVEERAKVLNIADGNVMYTGQIAGYGTLVIIDHGLQYFSVISNLSNLIVSKGEHVTAGDILGIYSKSQQLQGSGIHFEIRQGSTPLDPLLWLDLDQLTIDGVQASLYIMKDPNL